MSNAVLFCCYNQTSQQLAMSMDALNSILEQDIPVHVYALDNGSTPDTLVWLRSVESYTLTVQRYERNTSPVQLVNFWFGEIFGRLQHEHVLGVPNDVILPRNFYRELLRWPRGIVTASQTQAQNFPIVLESHAVNTCTPMAVAVFRKWAHDALVAKDGFFLDPRYFHYASDCDMALRIAACGITGIQLDLPYYHYCSATYRLADWQAAETMTSQADDDRYAFKQKWGFEVQDPEYGQRCGDINFRG